MRIIVTLTLEDDSTREELAENGKTEDTLKDLYRMAFERLVEAVAHPSLRHTITVRAEDNTQEADA